MQFVLQTAGQEVLQLMFVYSNSDVGVEGCWTKALEDSEGGWEDGDARKKPPPSDSCSKRTRHGGSSSTPASHD